MKEKYILFLKDSLPVGSAETIADWIIEYDISLKITRPRRTKLGDYRPPNNRHGHRISINHDLNQYAFLVTLVHEIAHLTTWEKYKNKVRPHGEEWKREFRDLLAPFMENGVFPSDVKEALGYYMGNIKASSCTDLNLSRTLKKYNPHKSLTLEELSGETKFLLNGRLFRKGEKLRKRYKCQEVQSNRCYLISPVAEVKIVDN